MGKVIALKPRKIEDLSSCEPQTKTLDQYLREEFKIKSEVEKILDSKNTVALVWNSDLQKIIKNMIFRKLIENRALNWDLFLCWEYVWSIIHNFMLWNISLYKYTQDFIEEWDYRWAADINLLKYIYEFHRRRHEPNTPEDYINRASTMYYHAYDIWQLNIWYTLAYELEELDKNVWLEWLATRIFS